MRGRDALFAAAALVVLAVVFSFVDWSGVGVASDPAPAPTPALPGGFDTHHVPLDGSVYRCVVYYHSGLDCDWDHPVAGIPTPTPGGTP